MMMYSHQSASENGESAAADDDDVVVAHKRLLYGTFCTIKEVTTYYLISLHFLKKMR